MVTEIALAELFRCIAHVTSLILIWEADNSKFSITFTLLHFKYGVTKKHFCKKQNVIN